MNIGDIVRIIKDFCGVGEVEVSDAIIKINAGDVNGLVSPINKEIMAKNIRHYMEKYNKVCYNVYNKK